MNNLFNTPFEISIRVLLLLSAYSQPVTAERIMITDFITTYGKDFGITKNNLNGDNSYRFSEFIARRELVQQAVKKLVLQRLIKPNGSKLGFVYALTDEGSHLVQEFVSSYAEKYLPTAELAAEYLNEKNETEVLKLINERAQTFEGE
ncbi:hypothetical protein ATS86_000608 [Listeria monocytogenes]|nr:hypothetical protein [Listeria monocytogenes]